MFARVLALLPLALLASASHLEARDSCSTGKISCCNSLQDVKSLSAQRLHDYGLLDILANIGGVNAGLVCDPVSVIGVGSNKCNAQVACCDHVSQNGLVNVGCSPIDAL